MTRTTSLPAVKVIDGATRRAFCLRCPCSHKPSQTSLSWHFLSPACGGIHLVCCPCPYPNNQLSVCNFKLWTKQTIHPHTSDPVILLAATSVALLTIDNQKDGQGGQNYAPQSSPRSFLPGQSCGLPSWPRGHAPPPATQHRALALSPCLRH
jgi:hypothetical protein